jgi:hypothetical protein
MLKIIKLSGLLTDMGIGVTAESDLNQQAYAAFNAQSLIT